MPERMDYVEVARRVMVERALERLRQLGAVIEPDGDRIKFTIRSNEESRKELAIIKQYKQIALDVLAEGMPKPSTEWVS